MIFENVRRPCTATIYSLDTNNVPAKQDTVAMKNAREAALLLNDLYISNGTSGGLTVLLDSEGKPIITKNK